MKGCFCHNVTGDLVKIGEIVRKKNYKEILERNAILFGHRLTVNEFILLN